MGDFIDYYSSALLSSTGQLSIFDIEPYQDGFLLRVPNRENPVKLEDLVDQPAMFNVFKEFIACTTSFWCMAGSIRVSNGL